MPNNGPELSPKKTSSMMVPVIVVLLVAMALTVSGCGKKTTNSHTSNTNNTVTDTKANTNAAATNTSNSNTAATSKDTLNLVAKATFASAPSKWFEEVWYQPKSSGGEVTYGADGVTFTGVQSNSRSGIMINLEQDVTAYNHLNLHMIVTNSQQTLTGTGWNGREAPVAVAISYLDAKGAEHKLLGEDPAAAGQMFWKGFYTLDATGQSVTTNGIKVTSGQKYTYNFDLMTLNPKPATIHFVAVEGAGWKPRAGTVHELSLIAVKGAAIENVPTAVNTFLDQSIIDELAANGFITYTGTTPPTIEGKYAVNAAKIIYDKNNEWTGRTLDNYFYTFSGQTTKGVITLTSSSQGANDSGSGNGGFISGKNNCFTVYVDLKGKQDTCDYDMPTLVSGCVKGNTIEKWNYALLMKSHTDNTTCNNEMTAVGNVRIIRPDTAATKQ
jgi:hypothetical protein